MGIENPDMATVNATSMAAVVVFLIVSFMIIASFLSCHFIRRQFFKGTIKMLIFFTKTVYITSKLFFASYPVIIKAV